MLKEKLNFGKNQAFFNRSSTKLGISTIIYMLHYGLFDETFLKEFVREQHVSIPKNTWKELISVIKKYKNDIPLWPRNGYSYKELNSQSKAKKVGRNEPCVCGSGKKYKHCCGK